MQSRSPRGLIPLGLARVAGDSMLPTLQPGDRLLIWYGAEVREGDLVVARFPDGALVVKRAACRRTTGAGAPGWWLLSDRPETGIDSRHRGAIADADVIARVLGRAWPHPVRIPGAAEAR